MHKIDILLVDPDTVLGTTVVEYVNKHSLTAAQATTAQSALQILESQKPKLIIIELALGKHSGIELLHEIKSYQEWQHIPIIVFSQQNMQQYAAQLQVFKVLHTLYKPQSTLADLLKITRLYV